MSELFPETKLHGFDFVQSAVDLVTKIAELHKLNLDGALFDMMHPNWDIKIAPESGVITIGSLEQLASNIQPVIDYFIGNKPKICVHIEPMVELYDERKLFDYLAIKFYRQRGYTEGLLGYLKEKEQEGVIEIIKVKRLYFGSLFNEGYNYMVWRPR